MARKATPDWEVLIAEAARSGGSVSEFCSLCGFSRSWFYRMARHLGFMDGGKRTGKWEAAASKGPVPVPREIVEGSRTGPCEDNPEICLPQLIIRYGKLQIAVGDHFSDDYLRRVLEVVVHA